MRRIAHIAAALFAVQAAASATASELGGPVEDLAYGDALFHFYKQDYFLAATRLLVAREQKRLPHHGDDAELLLGGLYLSYGQHDAATEIFERLLAGNTTPEVRDRAWLYVAEIAYQRGNTLRAVDALERISDGLAPEDDARRRLLVARVAVEQEQHARAVEALQGWRAPEKAIGYAQFNLGVALIRHGQADAGTALLQQVGGDVTVARVGDAGTGWLRRLASLVTFRRPVQAGFDGIEKQALRDKANLALGFAMLQSGDAETALPVLERVGADSPWSSKARLGAGWAALEIQNHELALQHWQSLADGDPLDPAVQESYLAVPFALSRLGAGHEALRGYQDAIDRFQAEVVRLDAVAASLNQGVFLDDLLQQDSSDTVGWFWKLKSLPRTSESRYLYTLVADHAFQEGLKNYRDLRFLRDNLDHWESGVSVYDDMLQSRQQRFRDRLDALDPDTLDQRLDRLAVRTGAASARLQEITHSRDLPGLATAQEQALLERLERVRDRLDRLPLTAQTEAAADKHRLLRGVLLWQVNETWSARLYEQRKAVQALRLEVARGNALAVSMQHASARQPQAFADFEQRIRDIMPRIGALRARVDGSLVAHEAYLRRLAEGQFARHQERLRSYVTEARYALASAYDRLARSDGDMP